MRQREVEKTPVCSEGKVKQSGRVFAIVLNELYCMAGLLREEGKGG